MEKSPIFTFSAHLKPTFCLDWHPELEDVLLTGSMDKTAKVWSLKDFDQKLVPLPLFTIQTTQSINKC